MEENYLPASCVLHGSKLDALESNMAELRDDVRTMRDVKTDIAVLVERSKSWVKFSERLDDLDYRVTQIERLDARKISERVSKLEDWENRTDAKLNKALGIVGFLVLVVPIIVTLIVSGTL